jgi:hypothetical protein
LGTPANSSVIDHNRIIGNDYGLDAEMQDGLEVSHNRRGRESQRRSGALR